MKHFIHGGPFAMCACGFKEDVALVGVTCLRCGQRAEGPFIIRRGKQIVYDQPMQTPVNKG